MNILESTVIYRNPKPHLVSRHAYFPSVVDLGGDEMLASYTVGEAFEAENLHTELSRSTDGGSTWEAVGPAFRDLLGETFCEASRITSPADGSVVALISQFDRSAHPGEGLSNEATLGLVETGFFLSRSVDRGSTWSRPEKLIPPLIGPSFELCSPIVELQGRWIFSTSTWRSWDGYEPNGMKMIMIESTDRGSSWEAFHTVMSDPEGKRIFWESKIVPLGGDRLLAVAWVYNEAAGSDEENHFAVSRDGGRTWSAPRSTGLHGQTMTPVAIDDDHVFFVYRRTDMPGLWAGIASVDSDDVWHTEDQTELWNGGVIVPGAVGGTTQMVQAFQNLRFGAPSVIRRSEHEIYLAFWAYESCVSLIRSFRIEV